MWASQRGCGISAPRAGVQSRLQGAASTEHGVVLEGQEASSARDQASYLWQLPWIVDGCPANTPLRLRLQPRFSGEHEARDKAIIAARPRRQPGNRVEGRVRRLASDWGIY